MSWTRCGVAWDGREPGLLCDSPVRELQALAEAAGFEVSLPATTVRARRVIVAVGGQSYPGCGTTGDGYALARRFGHTIVEPRPALVPIRVAESGSPNSRD